MTLHDITDVERETVFGKVCNLPPYKYEVSWKSFISALLFVHGTRTRENGQAGAAQGFRWGSTSGRCEEGAKSTKASTVRRRSLSEM